jgi:hypothetical protein
MDADIFPVMLLCYLLGNRIYEITRVAIFNQTMDFTVTLRRRIQGMYFNVLFIFLVGLLPIKRQSVC